MNARTRSRQLAAALLAALALAAAAGAAKKPPAWAQARLTGTWYHTVTQADYDALGIGDKGFGVGRWRIVVDKVGFVNAYSPSAPKKDDFDTKLTAGAHNRLWIGTNPICGDAVGYRGRIVDGALHVTKDQPDPDCPVRQAMFVGTWTRKPTAPAPSTSSGLRVALTLKLPGWGGIPTATPGAVWIPTTEHSGLARIDTATGQLTTPIAGSTNGAVRGDHFDQALAAYGSVWLASDYGESLRRVDPATGSITGTVALPLRPCQIAAVGGQLYLCGGFSENVLQVDPATLSYTGAIPIAPEGKLGIAGVAGDDTTGLWAVDGDGPSLVQIDTAAKAVTHRVSVLTSFPLAQGFLPAFYGAAGFGSVWTLNQLRDAVVRVDPGRAAVTAKIRLPKGEDPFGIAFGGGSVWVVDDSYVLRIDPATNAVTGWAQFPKATPTNFTGITWMDGAAWAVNADRGEVYKVVPTG
jgi:streptogramin lyase